MNNANTFIATMLSALLDTTFKVELPSSDNVHITHESGVSLLLFIAENNQLTHLNVDYPKGTMETVGHSIAIMGVNFNKMTPVHFQALAKVIVYLTTREGEYFASITEIQGGDSSSIVADLEISPDDYLHTRALIKMGIDPAEYERTLDMLRDQQDPLDGLVVCSAYAPDEEDELDDLDDGDEEDELDDLDDGDEEDEQLADDLDDGEDDWEADWEADDADFSEEIPSIRWNRKFTPDIYEQVSVEDLMHSLPTRPSQFMPARSITLYQPLYTLTKGLPSWFRTPEAIMMSLPDLEVFPMDSDDFLPAVEISDCSALIRRGFRFMFGDNAVVVVYTARVIKPRGLPMRLYGVSTQIYVVPAFVGRFDMSTYLPFVDMYHFTDDQTYASLADCIISDSIESLQEIASEDGVEYLGGFENPRSIWASSKRLAAANINKPKGHAGRPSN